MDNMHPQMRQALAPPAPRTFNDDDLYLIDMRKRRVIQEFSASSETARAARTTGVPLRVGQALLKGMQAKYLELQ